MGSDWKNKYAHLETKIGAGYYALREGTKGRTKLVVADRSPSGTPYCHVNNRVPSVGSRNDRPSTRRARRNS